MSFPPYSRGRCPRCESTPDGWLRSWVTREYLTCRSCQARLEVQHSKAVIAVTWATAGVLLYFGGLALSPALLALVLLQHAVDHRLTRYILLPGEQPPMVATARARD